MKMKKRAILILFLSQTAWAEIVGHALKAITPSVTNFVGGREVKPAVAPSVIKLSIKIKVKDQEGDGVCTSFQVGNCFLTAAHCFKYSTPSGVSITDPETGKPIRAESWSLNEDADMAVVKMQGPLSAATRAGRDSLCTTVPEGTNAAVGVGFGVTRFGDDEKKRVAGLLFHLPYEDSTSLPGLAFPSQLGSGDSGGPLIYRDAQGRPCVGGIASSTSESWDSSEEGLLLQKKEKETRYIPGTRFESYYSVAKNLKWINAALDEKKCTAPDQMTLTPDQALAELFPNRPFFADEKVSDADSKRLLKTLREEILDPYPKDSQSAARSAKALKEIFNLEELPRFYRPTQLKNKAGFYLQAINEDGSAAATIVIKGDTLRVVLPSKEPKAKPPGQ